MCGICGVYNFASQAPVELRDLKKMTRTMVHRGPDDEGYHLEGALGFGIRRLSIIDPEGGHQPMSDRENTVWVVFNGEIYNFPELKRELEELGHVFRTRCDTETIVLGYKQWGDDVLNRLNGVFGLAIWDTRQKRLVIARDRFGVKPVYYRVDNGQLWFGSEIRAVIATSNEKPEVNPVALNLFLRYRFTPSPHTLFAGVKKLAPGSRLTFENGTFSLDLWYRFKPAPFSPLKSTDEARDELLELYKRSIKRQLQSDVPIGLLLSGGVDSALLLALMNLNGQSWRTYTVGYGKSYVDDELADAAETAGRLSSRHTSVLLDRNTFEKKLPEIVSCMEEPVATSSIVPMYFVSERAREDVKVALLGQGADELFGGYNRHLGIHYGRAWRRLPKLLRAPVASAIRALPRNETLRRGIQSLDTSDRLRRYQNVLSLLPGYKIDGLFQDGIIEPATGDEILTCWQPFVPLLCDTDELGGFQFLELRSTLPDELLMYVDKLSMAHGLEARVPYLDKEIVEYVERLPADFKVRYGSPKWLHLQACQHLLPTKLYRQVTQNSARTFLKRRKRGFATNVVDDWFRANPQKLDAHFLDRGSPIYKYLRYSAIREMLEQHRAGRDDNHKILFSLVVFEEWLRGRGFERC